jgi:hypothetical protein
MKSIMGIRGFVKGVTVVLLGLLVVGSICEEEDAPIEHPSDETPYWDTDGDGISNSVETNPSNAHHNFNTTIVDVNPSIASGTPTSGSLEGGINLPDEGEGYYHYYGSDPIDTDDWGTLALINIIEGGGRSWWEWHVTPRAGFGDMSLQNGGNWPPHTSHQNGLDVDVRYVRNDGEEASINIATQQELYDSHATADLMNCLIQNGNIVVIYIDEEHANLENGVLQHWPGHETHFHVRIEDPDGTSN